MSRGRGEGGVLTLLRGRLKEPRFRLAVEARPEVRCCSSRWLSRSSRGATRCSPSAPLALDRTLALEVAAATLADPPDHVVTDQIRKVLLDDGGEDALALLLSLLAVDGLWAERVAEAIDARGGPLREAHAARIDDLLGL